MVMIIISYVNGKGSKEMYTGKEILNSTNKKYKVFINHKIFTIKKNYIKILKIC